MRKRKAMRRRASKRAFRRGNKVHKMNRPKLAFRGGIRL